MRTVCWFSCGAPSAVAAKIALEDDPAAIIAYCDTGSEHPDNERFLRDVEKWLGITVTRLKSEKYANTWEVFEQRRYLVGPKGALCTTELKKVLRFDFQQADDRQVFGYTAEEASRADRFRAQNFDVDLWTPLIEQKLSKPMCKSIVRRAGIKLPEMYRMGYRNNNCIGCVKGGAGYWNKIRVDFPGTFNRMALLEREIGASLIRKDGKRVFLDELKPGTGRYEAEPDIECGIMCPVDDAADQPKESHEL